MSNRPCRVAIFPEQPENWPAYFDWRAPLKHNWRVRKLRGELIPLYMALEWFRRPVREA